MKNQKYTPMMEQYLEIKNDYKDFIVFFRLGDFYEMFFEDAYIASKELELALTGKDAGAEDRVPMCGIPFHAASSYIEKMVSRGYKIAVVEQIEDPKDAVGIVKRGVVKIITPGTISSGLKDNENNFIGAISYVGHEYILCYSDVTTGEGYITSFKNFSNLSSEILSLHIREIIVNDSFNNKNLVNFISQNSLTLSYENNSTINEDLIHIVKDIDEKYYDVVGILLNYFIETQKIEPSYFKPFKSYISENYLHLDAFTKKNLELNETLRLNNRVGSVLWVLDKCNTAMGRRLMRKWLDKPLMDLDIINYRLDFVEALNNNYVVKEELKTYFKDVYDLERIIARISAGTANAKDLVWLRRSLNGIPFIKELVSKLELDIALEASKRIDAHEELCELLEKSLVADPPFTVKEGGMILDGYNSELDEIRKISNGSKDWILDYEKNQRELTGIKTLKVGYNRITGYYIEISKGALSQLSEDCGYQRRATLVNSERFISEELKHYEQIVLNAKEKIENLEYELFVELRDECKKHVRSLQALADEISMLDCFISLSDVAIENNYVRPTFNNNRQINIVDGRHPVLEKLAQSAYIVNDCVINKYNMMLITGPNMSGKSTYMKMIAVIAIMAQMGSFVPAKTADLMIFDAIYTRIGASDDLNSGQSTFMVEMVEANYALCNATKDSLVLFDEIGRGTATFDGMALAHSILEYCHEKIGCITLFSTHYHELTSLDKTLKRLKNVHVEAKEENGSVSFLHKVIDGACDKSYGINVANLAGLPKSIIKRSKEVLETLEENNKANNEIRVDLFNFDAFDEKEENKEEMAAIKIKNRIDEIDINRITPMDALNLLYELKEIK